VRAVARKPKSVIDLTPKGGIDTPKVARESRQKSKRPVPGFPPSLSRIPTELDRLYADFGGPTQLMQNTDKSMFVRPCNEFPLHIVDAVLSPYCKDNQKRCRCWPWVAFAVDQYRFEREVRRSQVPEPQPKQVASILDKISTSANSLAGALAEFEDLANRLSDPSAPFRRPYLAYLDQLIEEAAAGLFSDKEIEDKTSLALAHFRKSDFLDRVVAVEAIAREAKEKLDVKALNRPKGQMRDPALFNLVVLIGQVWTEVTGRSPSAEKIISKSRNSDDPDFVLLVKDIIKLAGEHPPTIKQIDTALRMSRAPL
jgi:hypothetical protein